MIFVIQVTHFIFCFPTYNVTRLDQMVSKCPLTLGTCGSMAKSGSLSRCKHMRNQAAPNVSTLPKAHSSPVQVREQKGEVLGHLCTEWELLTSNVTIFPQDPCYQISCSCNLDHQKIELGLGFTTTESF